MSYGKKVIRLLVDNLLHLILEVLRVGLRLRVGRRVESKNKLVLFPEFGKFGGTRDYLVSLMHFYRKNNLVPVLIFDNDNFDSEMRQVVTEYGFEHFILPGRKKILTVSSKLSYGYFFLHRLFAVARIVAKTGAGLVVVSSGKFILLSLLLLPAKLLYIFHIYPQDPLNFVDRKLLTRYLDFGKRVITVSSFSKNNVIKYCLNHKGKADFITVVYPGIRGILTTDDRVKENRETMTVLTLGHVAWTKNPETWIDVAKRVTGRFGKGNVEFIWAGEGFLDNGYLQECRKKVADRQWSNIHFIGFQRDVNSLYARTDVYFQPSKVENACLSVIDAMRHGLPCVTSNAGALPELVVDGISGYMEPPDDVAGLAGRIVTLLESRKLRRKMGDAGRRVFTEKFSYEIWESRILGIHRELLDSPDQP